jgi:hypothetical protein
MTRKKSNMTRKKANTTQTKDLTLEEFLGKLLNKDLDPPDSDPAIPELLDKCLKKAGTKDKWHSLLRHTIVNGAPLPRSETPPKESWWELGHYFQQFDDYILWHGLTVDCGEHCYNHTVKIYPDGKIAGSVNCFALGHMSIEPNYVKRHLEEWLGRIKEQPYWDEVDHVPVKK